MRTSLCVVTDNESVSVTFAATELFMLTKNTQPFKSGRLGGLLLLRQGALVGLSRVTVRHARQMNLTSFNLDGDGRRYKDFYKPQSNERRQDRLL